MPTIRTALLVLVLVELLVLVCFAQESRYDEPLQMASVVRVDDGDTIIIDRDILNGEGGKYPEKIRYMGIDTPEIHPHLECYGNAAARYNAALLSTGPVCVELGERKADGIGRTLGYVYTNCSADIQSMVNYQLLYEGYAFIYKAAEDWKYVDAFRDAQIDAVLHRRGLWGDCGEYTASNVVIAAIQFWSDDEFVVILNRGDTDVDLNGWSLTDTQGHTYEFREGDYLPAWSNSDGAPLPLVTVHSGRCAGQTSVDAHRWTTAYIWNDTGDTAYLKDGSGNTVSVYDHKGF